MKQVSSTNGKISQQQYILSKIAQHQGYIDRHWLINNMKDNGWTIDKGILELRIRDINNNPKYNKLLGKLKLSTVLTKNHDYVMLVEHTKTGIKLAGRDRFD